MDHFVGLVVPPGSLYFYCAFIAIKLNFPLLNRWADVLFLLVVRSRSFFSILDVIFLGYDRLQLNIHGLSSCICKFFAILRKRTFASNFGGRDSFLESWSGEGERTTDVSLRTFPFLICGAVSILQIDERFEIFFGIEFLFFGFGLAFRFFICGLDGRLIDLFLKDFCVHNVTIII